MNRIKRAWPWGAVGVAAAVAVLLAVTRPWRGAGAPGDDAAVEAGAGREALPPAAPAPLVHPEDVKWLSDATYVDDGGRMVSRYDIDGDGLADADELLLYGTLRKKVRAARAGDASAAAEIQAAKTLRAEGLNVHFRIAAGDIGVQSARTSDFLVGGF